MKLEKALKEFKRGNYSLILNSLESQIFIYQENHKFFYIMGMSSLFLNDIGGAYAYLTKAHRLDNENLYIRLALAAVLLKKGQVDKSIKIYLAILEKNPKNKYVKNALSLIKNFEFPDLDSQKLEVKTILSLIPEKKQRKPVSKVTVTFSTLTLILICVTMGGVLGAYKYNKDLRISDRGVPFRSENIENFINFDETSKFTMSEEQIKYHYNLCLRYFDKRHDNLARIEFNRLLHSNASEDIKNRVKTMDSMITVPDFNTFKDNHDYSVVINPSDKYAPYVYDRIFVTWKGRISDIEVFKEKIKFNFLIGYHDKKIVEGIVAAETAFAQEIDNRFGYEILGQIIVNQDASLFLRVISLRKIPEN
ncbi:MAG: tetratricopeptide repeat protein [Spirochaetales bacterium]|nr:tetratricopeptide repeat protein [Spirochaetales bacterium]